MAYRFVQGIDYGPRKGTLGWNIHMAEGGDGTLGWLAQRAGETRAQWANRVNGVSASFVILTTGEAVQMVGWDRAAGNLNPNDRSTDKAFYGRRFLLEVLGDKWSDPNAWTLSAEICGFRAQGPNQKQVDSLIEVIEESKRRFPGIRGAFGHADQTDTKGCPGTAPLMLQFWDRVGHGLFGGGGSDVPGLEVRNPRPWSGVVVVKDDGTLAAENHTRRGIPLMPGPPGKAATTIAYVPKQPLSNYSNVDFEGEAYLVGDIGAWILARNVVATPSTPGAVDEAAVRADQRAKDRAEVSENASRVLLP